MTNANDLNNDLNQNMGIGGDSQDSPLAILNRTEIDQQIATAKRYPRSITRAKAKMREMATTDEETAQGCIYSLKRRDSDGRDTYIEGPSVRLAEIAINAWGNIRAGARVIGEEGGMIVAQGVCHDLEANTFTSIEVRRRITKRDGRRYSDDMIGVTANAACAIALRNAVFKIVPKVYIQPAFEAARAVIAGDQKTIGERRVKLVDYFAKMRVSVEQLMEFLDKVGSGIDDITGDDLVRLHGVASAIRDGDTTIDEAFPPIVPNRATGASGGAAELNAATPPKKQTAKQPARVAPAGNPTTKQAPTNNSVGQISKTTPEPNTDNHSQTTTTTPTKTKTPKPVSEPAPVVDADADAKLTWEAFAGELRQMYVEKGGSTEQFNTAINTFALGKGKKREPWKLSQAARGELTKHVVERTGLFAAADFTEGGA